MHCIGHRGAAGLAPPNTLRSIQTAINLGCRWVEIDIWSIENQPVVFHDRRLERLTGATGLLENQTLESLAKLQIEASEPIPLLRDVFAVCGSSTGINIELKGPDSAAALKQFLSSFSGILPDIIVSSFDHQQLDEMRAYSSTIRLGVLIYGYSAHFIPYAKMIGAASIHFSIDFLQKRYVDEAHAAGMKALVYTVNHEDDIRLMQQLGVDGVFSDYPDRVLALCGLGGGNLF